MCPSQKKTLPTGAVTVYPTIARTEPYNATAIRVIWSMPNEFSDIVEEWYVEYRLDEEGEVYHAVKVERQGNFFLVIFIY